MKKPFVELSCPNPTCRRGIVGVLVRDGEISFECPHCGRSGAINTNGKGALLKRAPKVLVGYGLV